MKTLSIFGATGSVGDSAFDLLMRAGGPDAYRTVALTGGRNVARLAQMARALRAEVAVIADESLLGGLRDALAGSGTRAAAGEAAIDEAALTHVTIFVNGGQRGLQIVDQVGLFPREQIALWLAAEMAIGAVFW